MKGFEGGGTLGQVDIVVNELPPLPDKVRGHFFVVDRFVLGDHRIGDVTDIWPVVAGRCPATIFVIRFNQPKQLAMGASPGRVLHIVVLAINGSDLEMVPAIIGSGPGMVPAITGSAVAMVPAGIGSVLLCERLG